MKFNERKDREHLFGVELVPETDRDRELLARFWVCGVNLGAYNGQNLTFDFKPVKQTRKYDDEYMDAKLADLIEFHRALNKRGRAMGRGERVSQTDAILLYSLWHR